MSPWEGNEWLSSRLDMIGKVTKGGLTNAALYDQRTPKPDRTGFHP